MIARKGSGVLGETKRTIIPRKSNDIKAKRRYMTDLFLCLSINLYSQQILPPVQSNVPRDDPPRAVQAAASSQLVQ